MAITNYTDDNEISWVRIVTSEDDPGEYDAGYFWVNWREKGWDLANKTTTIEWACGVYCKYNFQNNAVRMDAFSINGVQVYSGGTYSNFETGSHTIATGTLDVEHNADGTKTLSISEITGWLYLNHNYTAAAAVYQWTGLSITEAADFDDTQKSISITISNPFDYTIEIWMDPNIIGDSVCGRSNSDITLDENGTYIWELSQDEIKELRNQCSGQECPVRLYVDTTIDGVYYRAYKDVTFTLVSDAVKPNVIDCYANPHNPWLANGFENLFIQGKSKASIFVNAEGKYGANIASCYVTMEGKTYEGEEFCTDVIEGSGDITITVRVEDTRGFYTEETIDIIVLSYSKPLVVPVGEETAILCYRSDSNGKRVGNSSSLWIKAAVSYHDVGGENACALQWRWKLAADEWPEADTWEDLPLTDNTYNTYAPVDVDEKFELTNTYTVQIRAIDTIGEQDPKTFDIPTEDVPLHLGKGGMKVTIGGYCDDSENRTFRSVWKAIFEAGVIISGDILIGESKMTLADYIKSVINEGG